MITSCFKDIHLTHDITIYMTKYKTVAPPQIAKRLPTLFYINEHFQLYNSVTNITMKKVIILFNVTVDFDLDTLVLSFNAELSLKMEYLV